MAQTGSGKTLAYLLPLLTRLIRDELPPPSPPADSPYALIVVPNRPLAWQISAVVNRLAALADLPVRAINELHQTKEHLLSFSHPYILVTTPSGLKLDNKRALERCQTRLADTRFVVVDEMDLCLGGSEAKSTTQLMWLLTKDQPDRAKAPLPRKGRRAGGGSSGEVDAEVLPGVTLTTGGPPTTDPTLPVAMPARQFVFCGATLYPQQRKNTVSQYLAEGFPNAVFLRSEGAFTISATTTELMLYLPAAPGAETARVVAQVLAQTVRRLDDAPDLVKPHRVILVFCRTARNAQQYQEVFQQVSLPGLKLRKAGGSVRTILYAKEDDEYTKARIIQSITHLGTLTTGTASATHPSDSVTTIVFTAKGLDRGMDIPNVAAVVMADFVTQAAEYIHCAGRTGRAGQLGEDNILACNRPRTIHTLADYAKVPYASKAHPKTSLEAPARPAWYGEEPED
ncbi:hypothetical protein IWQ60_011762 [Tieghemiomyces parasiticus]|uniref:ATP-dependent RNA helicase n=1 Tax=Tieghemiomyces parasiticus TaxID=78921 RepID=A0A9W8DL83_9FUNG|nr:hypothetical protein IWQ60_011762 [Tieghemiomyces parasiticus]